MNGNIGCIGLIVLVLLILWLALWGRKSRKGVKEFYGNHQLLLVEDAPSNVREVIGAKDPLCLKGIVSPISGGEVAFYWWEWTSSSVIRTGNTFGSAISVFLAISFLPNTVSEEFEQIAIREKEAKRNILKRIKDAVAINTRKPTRIEKLNDGTFIIFWQLLWRPKVYEDKIIWLKNTLSVPGQPSARKTSIETMAPESPLVISATPEPPPFAKATFYKHDSYVAMQQKFKEAWPNLELELNRPGPAYDHVGRDEFDRDDVFFDLNSPNEMVFWLNDETIASSATKLISNRLNSVAFILRNGFSIEDPESLKYGNEPFTLSLNEYKYGEFKRRFSERWPNLSIEMFDASPGCGGLQRGSKEIADDFDMSSVTETGSPLRDYIYIYEWADSLKRLGSMSAVIKNNELGIECDGNWRNMRLNAFDSAKRA